MSNRNSKSERTQRRSHISVSGCDAGVATLLRRAARRTLAGEQHAGRVEIMVLDGRAMDRLHHRWLGIRGATDVLTFDLRERRTRGRVDGQIAVCSSVARTRARELGHDWRHELALYVVHGCLHLCGYDDQSRAGFRKMHAREDAILSQFGMGTIFARQRVE